MSPLYLRGRSAAQPSLFSCKFSRSICPQVSLLAVLTVLAVGCIPAAQAQSVAFNGQTVPATGLNYPTGVAVDGAGDVYIADYGNNRVVEVTPDGTQTTVPATGLNIPTGVAVDSVGDVYIADTNNNRVVEVTPGGAQTTVPATGLNNPTGVAGDGAGDVYIADTLSNRVVEVTPGGAQTTVPATG
ncbi:MAG TPA: hypothetical protein VGG46_09105, partial [Terriglobales bacterium]